MIARRGAALGLWLALACRPTDPTSPSPPSGASADGIDVDDPRSFVQLRQAHPTRLTRHGPSTGKYEDWPPPDGAQRIEYESDGRTLWAWWSVPETTGPKPPVLVYFHGAFSLTPEDFAKTRPFRKAGYAVLTPTLRGENGNDGDLELLWGEVDDAVAAIEWAAAQPNVDGSHVYAIGHSIGGGVAALVSLRPDAPVRITGSVGGIYQPATFRRWADSEGNRALIRFDATIPTEGQLRTLGDNVSRMVHRHVAYIGDDDTWFHPNADAVASAAVAHGAPFPTHRVPGDHMSSLSPGLRAFLAVIEEDRTR